MGVLPELCWAVVSIFVVSGLYKLRALIGLFEDLGGYLNLIFYIYTKNDLSSNKSEDPVGKVGVVVVFSIFYGTI